VLEPTHALPNSSTADLAGQLTPPNGWAYTGEPRLSPRAPDRRAVARRLVAWVIYRVAKVDAANLFLALMQHWRLFFPWLGFAARLVPYGTLARRDTELAVLRVAWNCRSRYEWWQHVDIARRAGVTLDAILRIPAGSEAQGWTARESALLAAVDEIHHGRQLSDATWRRLAAHYPPRELLEICMLVGHYEMIASVLNTFRIPLDSRIEQRIAFLDTADGVYRPASQTQELSP